MQVVNKNNIWLYATLALCVIFILFKIPFLDYPCNGDEAYPYSEAIHYLTDVNLNIAPGQVPADISKGHPMIFQFFQAVWMKIFGSDFVVARLFPLMISIILLLRIYFLGARFFSQATGFFAAFLLAGRSIFFVQSTLLLPEVLLALFVLMTVDFYLRKKWALYFVAGSLMVLTKEPAIIFIPVFGLFTLISSIRNKNKVTETFVNLFFVAVPGLALLAFFLWQKVVLGWYVYPDHVRLMTNDSAQFFERLFIMYGNNMFVFYGGIFTTIAFFIFGLIKIFRKPTTYSYGNYPNLVTLLLFCSVAYLIFGAMNFASPRYMLCIYPLFFLVTIHFIFAILNKKQMAVVVSTVLAVINIGYLIDVRANGDCDLLYADAIKTRQQTIKYCVEQNWSYKEIFAPYFMSVYLTREHAGYLPKEKLFKNVHNTDEGSKNEIYIFPSDEMYPQDKQIHEEKFETLKEFRTEKYFIRIAKRQN